MKTKLLFSLVFLYALILNAQNYIINNDFETDVLGTLPAGWVLKYNGTGDANQKVVDNPIYNGIKAFQMEGQTSWTAETYKTPSSIPNLVTIETWVNPEKILGGLTGGFGLANVNAGAWGTYTSELQFFNGKISTLYLGGSTYVIQDYTPGNWYHLKMEHDLTARTYKVYIDGIQVSGDNGSEVITEFPMHPTVNSLHLRLIAGNYGTTKMTWDDIKVYETPNLAVSKKTINTNNYYVKKKILHFTNTQNLSNIKKIEIYNLLAHKVFESNIIQKETDISFLNQGIFILKVDSKNNGIETKKFVIQ
jgi:hypothetical protein